MRTDDVIEEIAARLEEPNLLDIVGIMSRKKRAREDADLRARVRQEQRKELARWVRSFKSGQGNSYATALERIEGNRFASGPDVAAALMAGHATLGFSVNLSTALENCRVVYEVQLTDKGRAMLTDAEQNKSET